MKNHTEVQDLIKLAAEKYPIKDKDCWLKRRRQEHLRLIYIERLKNESK